MDLYTQPDPTPTRKVTAGGLAAAVSVILVAILEGVGLEIAAPVASAITTVLGFVTAYFVKDSVQT